MAPEAVAENFTEVRNITAELIAKWQNLSPGTTISPIDELNRLDIETTTQCFYGRRLNNLSGPPHPMIAAMDGATSEAMKRPTRPKPLNWLLYSSKFNRDCATMRKYAADCLSYRKAHPRTDRQDLLWTMLNAKDPQTGTGLDERQILDEIVTMPIGSSTAPCVIASALYHLVQTPSCIAKARAEIAAVVGGSDAELTLAHLDHLPYCTAIVRESLRLSAAAPGFNIEPLPATPSAPVQLVGGKYTIPAKQTVIIVLHGVNRDPAVFPSPETFEPERMMGER
ncbi:MAG: hypothetical protein LQ352_003376, partial [Teloschistes flavicans]